MPATYDNFARKTAFPMARPDTLFGPFRIRNLTLQNRFVMPAMQRGYARNCMPLPRMGRYLRNCAEGGVGLIITEGAGPDHPSAYWKTMFCVIDDESRSAWEATISEVKAGGAAVLVQLWHVGGYRALKPDTISHHIPALSPSGLVQEGRTAAVAMTQQDLDEVRDAFVRSAIIAKESGADGVEVHCAHGFLLDQFLWHETNVREDGYGGATLVERARYPAEIVAAIRAAVGDDFLISVRFSQWKELDYKARIAQRPDELEPFIRRMRAAGADIFHVSTRRFDKPEWPDLHPGRSLAGWVRTMTDAAVIAVGSVGLTTDMAVDLFDGEEPQLQVEKDLASVRTAIETGEFDLIGVGRALIANNDFVARVRDGDLSGIVPFRKTVHLVDRSVGHS